MGLNVKTQYKGKMKDGYLQIQNIQAGQGSQCGRGGGFGTSEPNKQPKFLISIRYIIKIQDKENKKYKEIFTQGEVNVPYDLNSNVNIIQYGYETIKKLEDFKDAKDT